MSGKTVRVRGKHLVHDGRGYHGVELELDKDVADYYIAMGTAELVQSEPRVVPSAPEIPEGSPSPKGK